MGKHVRLERYTDGQGSTLYRLALLTPQAREAAASLGIAPVDSYVQVNEQEAQRYANGIGLTASQIKNTAASHRRFEQAEMSRLLNKVLMGKRKFVKHKKY